MYCLLLLRLDTKSKQLLLTNKKADKLESVAWATKEPLQGDFLHQRNTCTATDDADFFGLVHRTQQLPCQAGLITQHAYSYGGDFLKACKIDIIFSQLPNSYSIWISTLTELKKMTSKKFIGMFCNVYKKQQLRANIKMLINKTDVANSQDRPPLPTCTYCYKKDHIESTCYIKNPS